MKATLKNVAAALTVLVVVIAVLLVVDNGIAAANVSAGKTLLRVCVVDLDGNPVHNAQITVEGATFNTDNKGLSPAVELKNLKNCYDETVTEWGTVTVCVEKTGYIPAIAFNCVAYSNQTRKLTVKIYPVDGSDLPYVSYVESPPDEYAKGLLSGGKR